MQILGLLGMTFDVAVLFVMKFVAFCSFFRGSLTVCERGRKQKK